MAIHSTEVTRSRRVVCWSCELELTPDLDHSRFTLEELTLRHHEWADRVRAGEELDACETCGSTTHDRVQQPGGAVLCRAEAHCIARADALGEREGRDLDLEEEAEELEAGDPHDDGDHSACSASTCDAVWAEEVDGEELNAALDRAEDGPQPDECQCSNAPHTGGFASEACAFGPGEDEPDDGLELVAGQLFDAETGELVDDTPAPSCGRHVDVGILLDTGVGDEDDEWDTRHMPLISCGLEDGHPGRHQVDLEELAELAAAAAGLEIAN